MPCWYDPRNVHRVQFCPYARQPFKDSYYKKHTNVGVGVGVGIGFLLMIPHYFVLIAASFKSA